MTPTHTLAFALLMAANAAPSIAADPGPEQTVLVLDASGSMWGQIEGRAKIEVAREAIGQILSDWNGGALGLIAYGHRRKGDCADIELLQAPASGSPAAIASQVDALQPRGMTPISAAVRQAAEQLRHTEQKATVILVSDGEETCNADPCALAAELERSGVDFTAHVIGFDIERGSTADRQLACLAEGTGGRYVTAANAAELNRALDAVIEAAPSTAVATQTGRAWIPGHSLDWVAGTVIDDSQDEGGTRVIEFQVGQTAQECQTLCNDDSQCGGWHYEPTGSYFIDYPRCHLKGMAAPLQVVMQDEGWVAGVKPGVKLLHAEGAVP